MSLDEFRKHLPQYLFPGDEDGLYEALALFSLDSREIQSQAEKKQFLKDFYIKMSNSFYTTKHRNEEIIFQGDGLADLPYALPILANQDGSLSEKVPVVTVPGIIFSNTCDMDLANKRDRIPDISFAPIIELEKVIEIFKQDQLPNTKIESFKNAARHWEQTNVFYLPACGYLGIKESIVFFDQITSIQSKLINRKSVPKKRIFSLSMFGFYLLLFKISVHFSRFKEKVERPFLDLRLFEASLFEPGSVD